MKKKILIAVDDFSSGHLHAINMAVMDWAEIVRIPQTTEQAVYRKVLSDAAICIGWPLPEWIFNTSLKLLQTGSSGWENYQNRGLEQISGFSLCTAKGIYSIGVAEHAIAMMFALVRRIPVHVHDKDQRLFKRHLPYAPEITGTVACIVGMGDIGKEMAKRCKGLGMKVTAVVRNKQNSSMENTDQVFPSGQLRTAVANADHIFLCIPGGTGNDQVFNEAVFSALKPSAFFYNISRGTTVDEEALYDYLANGKIAGAGLDVAQREPLPPESKLWSLGDHVLITGHSAGLSAGHTGRFCSLAIKNLSHFNQGLPLENKVMGTGY